MLDPDLVLAAVLTAFRDIPLLTAVIPSAAITSHTFVFGEENSLLRNIEQAHTGSILVTYQDLLEGNFSGETRWKHRLLAYIRPHNRGASPPHIWWLMMNKPMTSTGRSFRASSLLSGSLYIPDTPTLTYQQDSIGSDLFVGSIVLPEAGDE